MNNVTRPDVFIRKRFKKELVLFHENYYLIIFCQISVGQWVLLENQSFLSGTICHTAAVAVENQRHRPNYLTKLCFKHFLLGYWWDELWNEWDTSHLVHHKAQPSTPLDFFILSFISRARWELMPSKIDHLHMLLLMVFHFQSNSTFLAFSIYIF